MKAIAEGIMRSVLVAALCLCFVLASIAPVFAGDNAKDFARWTIRVGVAHDSYARTAPGNPSATGPGLQIQYNVSPTFFIQATITQNTIVYQTTNFMVFVGWEFHP